MAQEITLPVRVQLENLQSIAKDMRSQLGTLKVDSSSYKKLEGVIGDIEKRIQQLQVISSRPFIDTKQFTAVSKEIGGIQDDLTKVRIEAGKVKFSDLSLDAGQKAKLQEFDKEIKSINDSLKQVKDSAKSTFLESDIGKAWAEKDPKIVTKSFTQITKIIEEEVARQKGLYNEAVKAQNDYKERMSAGRKLAGFINKGHELSKANLGDSLYNQIFNEKGNFRNGGRNMLSDWLKKEFQLNPEVVDALVKDSGQKVAEAFAKIKGDAEAKLKSEHSRINADIRNQRNETNNGKTLSDNIVAQGAILDVWNNRLSGTTEATIKQTQAEQELSDKLEQAKAARQDYVNALTRAAAGQLQMGDSCTKASAQLNSLNNTVETGKQKLASLDQAASKLQGISNFVNRYVGAYAIIRKVTQAIRNAFSNIKDLDKVITSIAVVTNMSQEDLWNKIGQYTSMAQEYGVATKDVYTVSQIFYQQGLQTAQVMDLTTETLKMAKIAGMGYSEAANAMTVAVRAFNIEMENAQRVTDTYSALAAKFAVSSAEIANAMEKTASSAASVGMSVESASAFISVMEQTTRESAQNIGSALKSIISRYGEMKASPDKLINVDGEEVAFNKVDTALASVGISIKDAAGQFRDFDDVIMELASKWNTLDNNTQRYIATIMAGNRQQSRFIALVSNYDELSRAMQVANNAENASIVQVAKTMDSLETKTNQLKNAFSQLYLDLHVESGLKSMYDWLTRILQTIGKLGTLKGALPTLMNIVGFGTGTKGLIKSGMDAIQAKKAKYQIDTEEAKDEITRIREEASRDIVAKYKIQADTAEMEAQLAAAKAQQGSIGENAWARYWEAGGHLSKKGFMSALGQPDKTQLLKGLKGKDKREISEYGDAYRKQAETVQGLTTSLEAFKQKIEELNGVKEEEKKSTESVIERKEEETRATKQETQGREVNTQSVHDNSMANREDTQTELQNADANRENTNAKKADSKGGSWAGHETAQKVAGVASSIARMAGTALAAAGAAHQDKSTDTVETSKILTGVGNGLSMAGTGASMGMAFGPWGAAVGAVAGFLAGGVGAILDGLHMSLDERLALEKAEAKKKSDEALKAQAKALDISSSLDNLKQLRAAMYNSAEDAEKYTDAMNSLGQQYPGLISSYDSMGNAIIDLQDAEQYLIGIRQEASRTARETAQAEMQARNTQIEIFDNFSKQIANIRKFGNAEGNLDNADLYRVRENNESAHEIAISKTTSKALDKLFEDLVNKEYLSSGARDIVSKYNQEGFASTTWEEVQSVIKEIPEEVQQQYSNKNSGYMDSWDGIYDLLNGQQYSYAKSVSSIDDFLKKYATDLGIAENTTARDYFNWGEGSISLDMIADAENRINAIIDGYKRQVEVQNKQVTRAFAEEQLGLELTGNDNISNDRNLKISNNKIFSSLITAGLEREAKQITQTQNGALIESGNAATWSISDQKGEFIAKKAEITKSIVDWISKQTDSVIDSFIEATGEMDSFLSADELLNKFNIDKESELGQDLIAQFAEQNQINRDRIVKTIYGQDEKGGHTWKLNSSFEKGLGQLNNGNQALDIAYKFLSFDGATKIVSEYADYFTTQLLDINKLAESGYTELASQRLTILSTVANKLSEITDSDVQNSLFGILTTTDFTDFDSLTKTAEALQTYADSNNEHAAEILPILEQINKAKDDLLFNLNTLAESVTEKISTAAKEIDGVLTANTSGFDLSKALDALAELNSGKSLEEAMSFDEAIEFNAALGKYVYTADGLKALMTKTEEDLLASVKQLEDTKKLYEEQVNFSNDSMTYDSADQILKNIDGYDSWSDESLKILYSNLANDFMNDKTLEHTQEAFAKYIEAQAKAGNEAAARALEQWAAYQANKPNTLFQAIDWSAIALDTDYSKVNAQLMDDLIKELGGNIEHNYEAVIDAYLDKIYGKGDSEAKTVAKKQINDSIVQDRISQYQDAISEILDPSAEISIATNKLLSDIDSSQEAVRESAFNATNAAKAFLDKLAKQIGEAGYNLEQYNKDATSILESVLNRKTTGKALLDFVSEDNIGTSQIEGLANTLNKKITDLIDVTTGEFTDEIFSKYFSFDRNSGSYKLEGSFSTLIDEINNKYHTGIDKTSKEYLDAYDNFVNAQIELEQQGTQRVKDSVETIKNIGKAKAGDKLNVSTLETTLETGLAAVAEKYGATIIDGVLTIEENTNIPGLMSEIAEVGRDTGKLIPEQLAELADAIEEYLSNITSLLQGGIKGNLSNSSAQQLQSWATQQGINDLEFTKTAEGLKLSERAAMQLYFKLRQIDKLQASLVFEDLRDSLEASRDEFKDTQSLLQHVKDIREGTYAADKKVSKARQEQYQAELAVAEEILKARATSEDDSFKFMDNKIPAGQNNPLNYMKNWGEAFKAMKEASSGGKGQHGVMAYEDFYNIVTEMGHIAELSGVGIKYGQDTLHNAEEASELITKAAGALRVMPDGEMKVDLKGIGWNFETGAEQMADQVNKGIDAVADSQIAMLDSMISLLEVVVAMEKLGDIDVNTDNHLNIGEIFDLEAMHSDEESAAEMEASAAILSNQFRSACNHILDMADSSEDLKNALNSIKVNGTTMYQLFKDAANGQAATNMSVREYQQLMDSFYQMAISNDYDLDNIAESISRVMQSSNLSNISIDVGESTFYFNGDFKYKINWDDEKAKKALEDYIHTSLSPEQYRETIEQLMKDRENPDLSIEQKADIDMQLKIASGEVKIEQVKGKDGKQHFTGTYNGVTINCDTKDQVEAEIKKAIEYEYDGWTIRFNSDTGKVEGTKVFNGATITIHETAEGTKYKAISKTGQTADFSTEEEALAWLASLGEGQTGTYHYDGKDYTVFVDAKTGITYSLTSDNKYVCDGQEFKSWEALQNYLLFKDQTGDKFKNSLIDDDTIYSIQANGKTKITYNFASGEIKYWFLSPKGGFEEFSSEEEYKEYLAAYELSGGRVDSEGNPQYEVGGTVATITVNTDGNVTFHARLNNGFEVTAPDEESLKFAIAAHSELKGGEISNKTEGKNISYTLNNGTFSCAVSVTEEGVNVVGDGASSIANYGEQKIKAEAEAEFANKTITVEGTPKAEVSAAELTLADGASVTLEGEIKLDPIPSATGTITNLKVEAETVEADGAITDAQLSAMLENTKIAVTVDKDQAIADLGEVKAKQDEITNNPANAKINPDASIASTNIALGKIISQLQTISQGAHATISGVNDGTIYGAIASVNEALKSLQNKTIIITAKVSGAATGNVGIEAHDNNTSYNDTKATGNVGVAKANGTLMGELGPELVVSNGRYFVAGQNGAEFVNLADDAIVFNHLQTEQLLKNGVSSTRGRAITNERKAVAFAHGTMNGGDAMASASAALAALKQLRAMWQSLKNATAQDLAGMGGAGGGGGGNKEDQKAFIKNLEKWYNWLQEIATLEEKINYQEKLRNKISSGFRKNGQAYYNSQKTTMKNLESELKVTKDLVAAQQAYFNKRRQELNSDNNPFSSLYTFDENGQLKYKKGKLAELSKLSGVDKYGNPNMTPKQQYDYIVNKLGIDPKYLETDASGNKIDKSQEGWEVTAVQTFWDKMEAQKEEMQSTHDSINEYNEKILELQTQQNELLHEMQDNQIEVENAVLNAMVETRQREIDEFSKLRDTYEETSNKLVSGLSDALSKEKDQYNRSEEEQDLLKLRRRLAVLQRTGGSASEIQSLQKEIASKSQDAYFDKQQEQIDQLQEAADAQIERMDRQIDIMTQTLEYQKKYGLLWNDVYKIMEKSPAAISNYIQQNTEEYWGKSPLASTNAANDWLFKTEQWVGFRKDLADTNSTIYQIYHGLLDPQANLEKSKQEFRTNMQAAYGDKWDKLSDSEKKRAEEAFEKEYAKTGNTAEATKAGQKSVESYQVWKDTASEYSKKYGNSWKNLTKEEKAAIQTAVRNKAEGKGTQADIDKALKAANLYTESQRNKKAFTVVKNSDGTQTIKKVTEGSKGAMTYDDAYKKMFNNDWSAYVSGQGNEWKMLTDKQVAAFKAIYQKAYNSAAAGNKAAAAAKALEASDEYKKEYVQAKNAKKWSIQQDSTTKKWSVRKARAETKKPTTYLNAYNAAKANNKLYSQYQSDLALYKQDPKKYKKPASPKYDKTYQYERGGMVPETGWAFLHADEGVLTSEQTDILRNEILGGRKDSLINLLSDFRKAYSGTNPALSVQPTTIIENASVNMYVNEISSDYSARRAADTAYDELLRIARKNGTANSIRR